MKKILLLITFTFVFAVSGVFASIITATGYGADSEKVKQDVDNKIIEKLTNDVFKGNVPSDVSFDGIESLIEYSNIIRLSSSNSEYRYRMIGSLDSDKAVKYLEEKTSQKTVDGTDEDALKTEEADEAESSNANNVITMNPDSATIYEGTIGKTSFINTNQDGGNQETSMSDFMQDYEKRQEAMNKLQEERRRDELSLKEKEARVVRLSWGIGLNIFFPINSNSENIVVSNRLAPTVNIGIVVKNRLIISLGASPTFAQRNQKTPKLNLGMSYYRTYLDLNVSYKADWNSTFLYIGVGAGLDVDSAKEIYIMPQVAFALNFDKFRPVFDSAEAKIAVRYTFSTKIWDLGVEFTLKGLY